MGVLDTDVLHVLGRQYGVVGRAQLEVELGWSASKVFRARRAGVLIDETPRVLRLASSPPSYESRCMTAQLHFDGISYVSAWSAGRLHGLRGMPNTRIHITVPERTRRDVPPRVRATRSSWFSDEDMFRRTDGLVVATPMRMLFGLAAAFGQHRFERAAEDAWSLGIVTPQAAAEYLEQHRCRGKDGVSTMHAWLEHALEQPRPAQSGLEQLVLECIARVGLPPPVRQHPLVLPSGELVHLDIAWPDVRLAVEPGDSWWHGGALRQRKDHARDRACGELGWHIIRFDESLRDDPMSAARQIRRIHATRATRNSEQGSR